MDRFVVYGYVIRKGKEERFVACYTWSQERVEKYIANHVPGGALHHMFIEPRPVRFTWEDRYAREKKVGA